MIMYIKFSIIYVLMQSNLIFYLYLEHRFVHTHKKERDPHTH